MTREHYDHQGMKLVRRGAIEKAMRCRYDSVLMPEVLGLTRFKSCSVVMTQRRVGSEFARRS